MEQGGGSSFWEKGVMQNGNRWIPSTPQRPVLQGSSNAQSEIRQNQTGRENWGSLIDMYEDLLQNKKPHGFDLNVSEDPSLGAQNYEGVPPAENYSSWQQSLPQTGILGMNGKVQNSQDVAPFEAYNMYPLNPGVNNLELNNQNVGMLQKLGSLNPNARTDGSSSQNLGEVVSSQEVNSFSELMRVVSAKHSPPLNGTLYRGTFCEAMPTVTRPVSQLVSNNPYASVGVRAQQNHILHASNHVAYATVGAGFPGSHVQREYHDGGGYNQQEILNSKYTLARKILFTFFLFYCNFFFFGFLNTIA